MKKRTAFTALLMAAALLFPAFTACENKEQLQTPPSIEESVDGENGTENDTAVSPETPDSPQNPEIPENNENSNNTGNLGNTGNSNTAQPEESKPTVTPIGKDAEYIRCTGDSVNLRAGAGTEYAVIGSAKKGEIYAAVGKSGAWYQTYYRGKKVYLSASYAALLSLEKHDNKKVESVIAEGYKLLGVPYVYGAVRVHDGNGKLLAGFSAQKFDCSSLIQYVFYKGANVLLQVHTRSQVSQGKYVARSNLQRGDCIYFTNESRKHLSGVERIGHVALYLGDNYILHTASDYARIEKMSASRWNYYVEARRFM